MFEVGTVCIKIAGRDSGEVGIVVDVLGNGYVLFDGNTRRRKCNINHLEPLGASKIKKNASHADVEKGLGKICFEKKKKKKKRERKKRPLNIRKGKQQQQKAVQEEKKTEKKKHERRK